jgi:uncharacterized protein (TIGR03437 family)
VRHLFLAAILGASAMAGPSITGVYNAGSWIPTLLPNSGISQGAIFTITGNGLGPGTLVQVPSYPLPTTQGLSGTTVSVVVGSTTENCIMVYTYAGQVAAILPSATPVGNGTLTLTYQGTSASVAIQVVAGSFGMFTLNEGGSGAAVVTDLSYNAITMVNAAHPGDNVILWGTGLGAVTGDETEPPSAVNFPGVQVLIGNQLVTPSYAGRSSSPGLDQINVTIPAGINGGCKTTLAVVVNGVTGNVVSTSVAPAGQTMCGDTYGALTTANLQKAVASGSLNLAAVDLSRVSTDDDTFVGDFATYPLNSLIRSYGGSFAPSIGNCIGYELVSGETLVLSDPILSSLTHLSPGSPLLVTPHNGKATSVSATETGVYAAAVGTSSSAFISPGVYSVANGNGTSQVAAFNWSATLPAEVSFTGLPSTIDRSQDLTVTWTNSAAFSFVTIFGYAGVVLNGTQNSYYEFVCSASASASQFTIPSAILKLLPTNGYGAFDVPGVGIQVAGVVENMFTVAGSPGIDAGVFAMFTSNGSVVKAQ